MNLVDLRDARTDARWLYAAALVAALVVTVACSGPRTTEPSPLAALEVERLDVAVNRVGDLFIGRPTMRLRETSGVSRKSVREVRFSVDGRLDQDIRTLLPNWIVPAGGVLDLLPAHAEVELSLGTGAAVVVTVTVLYEDDDGHAGSARGEITVALTIQAPAADVRLEDVTVRTNLVSGYHIYVPTFRVVEVGGTKGFSVTGVHFDLIDGGPEGAVPPTYYSPPLHVDAGGTLTFAYDVYGPPFEISSSVLVSRVRIVISFVDDDGTPGSALAVASVISDTRL